MDRDRDRAWIETQATSTLDGSTYTSRLFKKSIELRIHISKQNVQPLFRRKDWERIIENANN